MNVTKNRVVSIDYTLKDDKDHLIDSTSGAEPLDYLHGFENIISGLEKALEGKNEGDHFTAAIQAAEAYGERDDKLIADIPRENFAGVDSVEPGMQFHTQTPDGPRMITVVKVENDTVTIDGNHPLAGLDLNFDVTIMAVREASEEELEHGHVHGHDHDHHDCEDCGCDDDCDSEESGECGGCGCGH
jgi:FKBP-type peptidyl-prolyl cis-trans isomerase SlyD